MKRIVSVLALALIAATATADAITTAEIQKILADRIDSQRQSVGIVVGVIEPSGRRIVSYGSMDRDGKQAVNGDTLFEIGSATKVFTALLLADMVRRGEVALSDPLSKFLPPEVKLPAKTSTISLEQLATHTSALPRLPANLSPKDATNPYADYSVAQLYDFLAGYELTREIGEKYEYSNLGAGLLGHLLARRAGVDYETLVRNRILRPLGMKSTMVTLSPTLAKRLATGHDQDRSPTKSWDFLALAGAGAFRSTANDLLTFLAAQMGVTKTPLAPAMTSMLAARRKTHTAGMDVALGWHIVSSGGRDIIWHNGGTGGYRSFLGYDPVRKVGVVVLSNTFTNRGIDDIGRHLLDTNIPLLAAEKQRKIATIDPAVFDQYVGRYQLAPNFILTVTRDEKRLFVQATGQERFEVYPESARDYFYKVVDAQITFESDGSGRAQRLVLHQNGADQTAHRIEGEVASPKEIAVDEKVLERYVGRYELTPAFVLTVTSSGGRLFVQATGQPMNEVFPKEEREFFYKVVDAQIVFVVDGSGRTTGLVLHQNNREMPARRIE